MTSNFFFYNYKSPFKDITVIDYIAHTVHFMTHDQNVLHEIQWKKKNKNPPKISRRKDIINIWAEINEKQMKEIIVKINKTKSWFFEKINKIDQTLARPVKRKTEESNQQN